MKKTLISVLVICLSALGLSGCFPVAQQAAGAPQGATTGSMLAATMPMIIILLVMYLVMIVPERKRKTAKYVFFDLFRDRGASARLFPSCPAGGREIPQTVRRNRLIGKLLIFFHDLFVEMNDV